MEMATMSMVNVAGLLPASGTLNDGFPMSPSLRHMLSPWLEHELSTPMVSSLVQLGKQPLLPKPPAAVLLGREIHRLLQMEALRLKLQRLPTTVKARRLKPMIRCKMPDDEAVDVTFNPGCDECFEMEEITPNKLTIGPTLA